MSDRREEILNQHATSVWLGPSQKEIIKLAMDEYMRQTCLELLEYMAKHTVECEMWVPGARFHFKDEWLTAEQLFENFL